MGEMCYFTPEGRYVSSTDQRLILREDNRVEKVCKHGVGHPVGHLNEWETWIAAHGCDGCCCRAEF